MPKITVLLPGNSSLICFGLMAVLAVPLARAESPHYTAYCEGSTAVFDLGGEWLVQEGNRSGRWVRQGGSRSFDTFWTDEVSGKSVPSGEVVFQSTDGWNVKLVQKDTGKVYQGYLSCDKKVVNGSDSNWKARIVLAHYDSAWNIDNSRMTRSRLVAISKAIQSYADDHGGRFPSSPADVELGGQYCGKTLHGYQFQCEIDQKGYALSAKSDKEILSLNSGDSEVQTAAKSP